MEACKICHGLSRNRLRRLAWEFAKKIKTSYPPKWNENAMAGEDWYTGFMKRHPELTLRTPEQISANLTNRLTNEISNGRLTNRRSLRGTYHPKMENALHKWYLKETMAGVTMTTNMIRAKARELYTKIRENDLDFQASPGWVEKFKRRYGIRLQGAYKKRTLIEEETDSSENSAMEGEQEIDQNIGVNGVNTADPFEIAFVDVSANNCDENLKAEQQVNEDQKPHGIMQCIDEVIQWTVGNRIEPLYLTMLRSLRDRIQNPSYN